MIPNRSIIRKYEFQQKKIKLLFQEFQVGCQICKMVFLVKVLRNFCKYETGEKLVARSEGKLIVRLVVRHLVETNTPRSNTPRSSN